MNKINDETCSSKTIINNYKKYGHESLRKIQPSKKTDSVKYLKA